MTHSSNSRLHVSRKRAFYPCYTFLNVFGSSERAHTCIIFSSEFAIYPIYSLSICWIFEYSVSEHPVSLLLLLAYLTNYSSPEYCVMGVWNADNLEYATPQFLPFPQQASKNLFLWKLSILSSAIINFVVEWTDIPGISCAPSSLGQRVGDYLLILL